MAKNALPRLRNGPPPDPNALRRDRDGADWLSLLDVPVETPAPAWPWPEDPADEVEQVTWMRVWRSPLAQVWRGNHEDEVAVYVRTLIAARARAASASMRTLFRQAQESLLLTQASQRAARIKIVDAQPSTPLVSAADIAARKVERLKVLHGGDTA